MIMKIKSLLSILFFSSLLFASGGFDNGTSNGKGKFQIDLTINPFNKIKFGQSYTVLSYGLTNKLDFHGYFSNHANGENSWYLGIFYQFIKLKKIDLATAIGFRRKLGKDWTHIFAPQLLYTFHINEKISLGGSIVNVKNINEKVNYGQSIDIGIFYKFEYQTKIIESVSMGIGGFHPVTWNPKQYFLPTYSIDFKFK